MNLSSSVSRGLERIREEQKGGEIVVGKDCDCSAYRRARGGGETAQEVTCVVVQVSESDDYEDIARLGMSYRTYDGAMLVLVHDPVAGWWVNQCVPYLMFYKNHPAPSPARAKDAVQCAIRTGAVAFGVAAETDLELTEPLEPHCVVTPEDPNDFAALATLGMRFGRTYPHVTRQDAHGQVRLLFSIKEPDRDNLDLDLDAALDSLT